MYRDIIYIMISILYHHTAQLGYTLTSKKSLEVCLHSNNIKKTTTIFLRGDQNEHCVLEVLIYLFIFSPHVNEMYGDTGFHIFSVQ